MDDPNGQLPGTGIPGDSGDSLYRSSSLRRRRDASPVRGTMESVGQEGVGVVPERPSLFSTSGSSSFNPFSAALSSLRPEERAEVNQTGVSDALQRYANQEMRRLFAEHLRSLPQEPISSSFDLFGMSSRMMSAGRQHKGLELLEELHKFITSGLQVEVRMLEVVFFRVFHLKDLLFHLILLHLLFRLDLRHQ